MTKILEKTYNAAHVWVHNNKEKKKKSKIDCMFFPCNSNPMVVDVPTYEPAEGNEIKLSKETRARPTFILCSSNAMFWQ